MAYEPPVDDEYLIASAKTLRGSTKASEVDWPQLRYFRLFARCSSHGDFNRTVDEQMWERSDGMLICPGEHGGGVVRRVTILAFAPETFLLREGET